MKTPHLPHRRSGFSLVELLVVCAIIGIVVSFTIPAATTMMRGSQLTQGSQMVVDQIALARQLALSRSLPVEVRFYKCGDPEVPGEDITKEETWKYRAFQTFEIQENGAAIPLSKIQRLPSTVVMAPGKLSSLINEAESPDGRGEAKKPGPNDPEIPRLPVTDGKPAYVYHSFRFLQDGSTNLPPVQPSGSTSDGKWYVTLVGINDPVNEETTKPPANFFTLQVDPVSGATKTYRPTAG